MEGTIGEVRLFAASFAPKNWAYCDGSIVAIRANTALFSILGTTYGGDGRVTFGLPNLVNSVAVGAGSGPGLTPRTIGETGGANAVTLLSNALPAHTHSLLITPSVSMSNTVATIPDPNATPPIPLPTAESSIANSVLSNGTSLSSYIAATPDISLNAATVSVSAIATTPGNTIGGNQPHNNLQPSMGMAFVVCLYGVFPARP
jgi:microcystin-dependent protein